MPRKLTEAEYNAIREHNDTMLAAAESAIAKFKSAPNWQENQHIREQMQYWLNVRSALRWSVAVALQRMK